MEVGSPFVADSASLERVQPDQGTLDHPARPLLRGHAHQPRGERLPDWLDAVRQDDLPSLHTLAGGIDRDGDAVIAGLTLSWNSGVVEGHVNRIAILKRQMFGRQAPDFHVNASCSPRDHVSVARCEDPGDRTLGDQHGHLGHQHGYLGHQPRRQRHSCRLRQRSLRWPVLSKRPKSPLHCPDYSSSSSSVAVSHARRNSPAAVVIWRTSHSMSCAAAKSRCRTCSLSSGGKSIRIWWGWETS